MSVPDDLTRKLALFAASGGIYREQEDLFAEASWLQVMYGQGRDAAGYHPMADQLSTSDLSGFLADLQTVIERETKAMPTQVDFIAANCAAKSDV